MEKEKVAASAIPVVEVVYKRYWRQKADAEPELPIALAANLDQILRPEKFFNARATWQ
jgi:hypothetical protein